jgi:hypothetical protein
MRLATTERQENKLGAEGFCLIENKVELISWPMRYAEYQRRNFKIRLQFLKLKQNILLTLNYKINIFS